MDYFELVSGKRFSDELIVVMNFYDYKYSLTIDDFDVIIRKKKDGAHQYKSIEEFLLSEIFYKKKKNLHYFPIENTSDTVCNFDIGPFDIVKSNPLLKHMLDSPIYKRMLTKIHNFATFIRFSENKVQRLYWNPPINAGIPLTAKEKDPVYELIFLMHDFGHFLLPDLVPTGESDCLSKKFYVNWRLLGESITVVLNEMILVDYLKDKPEFIQMLKLDFDKPYKLFRILKKIDFTSKEDIYKLFHASYMYFCIYEPTELMELIDKETNLNWKDIWTEFDERYRPVALRGREWTESNFDNIAAMSVDYRNWYQSIKHLKDYLDFETLSNVVPSNFEPNSSDAKIMEVLFDRVFQELLLPLFTSTKTSALIIPNRKIKSFVRYMVGNLFILVKHYGCASEVLGIIEKLVRIDPMVSDEKIEDIRTDYLSKIYQLYKDGRLSCNEYHNYKNIFIMIPPNILKKDAY